MSCHTGTEPPVNDNSGPLIPLAIGNYWIYQSYTLNADGSVLFVEKDLAGYKITDTLSVSLNGDKKKTFQYAMCDSSRNLKTSDTRLIYSGKDGLYYAGITDSGIVKMSFVDLMFKYPVNKSDETLAHTFYYDPYGNPENVPDSIVTTYTCVSTDSLFNTPVGNFKCVVYKLKLMLDDVFYLGDVYYFIKPGLGLVGIVYILYSYITNKHYYATKSILVHYKLN